MLKRTLLKIWRDLPVWLQVVLSRLIQPLHRVFVAAVILDSDRNILLVKSTYQRFHPWGLPGGAMEYGEHPEEAAVREIWEETGLNVSSERLLLVRSWPPDRLGLYYLCRVTGGTFRPSDEVSEFAYFSLEHLPDVKPLDQDMLRKLHSLVAHELA
jgi:ADP-ribose pyrophosphatase YjhB (NUDIX family)